MALNTPSIDHIYMGVIIILIIAIIILPDTLKNNSMLTRFLEDNINIGLIVIIIILVSELNKVVSVLLLLLFAILVVMTRMNTKKQITPTTAPISGIALNNYHTEMIPVKENFVRSRVPVYPGQPANMGQSNPEYNINESATDFMVPPANVTIEKFTCNSLPLNDLPTQQLLKAVDGFDIAGCRYDNKNCAQNTSRYGGPLADCNSYDLKMAAEVGTVFYPLNA
jgi:hypothetical protein